MAEIPVILFHAGFDSFFSKGIKFHELIPRPIFENIDPAKAATF